MTKSEQFNPSHIRVISFDLDDTLWPVGPVIAHAEQCLKNWLNTHHPRVHEQLSTQQMQEIRAQVYVDHPHIRHNLTALRQQSIGQALQHAGYHTSAATQAMNVFLAARNNVTPFPQVTQVLAELQQTYSLVALSNGNADISKTPLAGYFQMGLNPANVGAKKPDQIMFSTVSERVNVAPHECVHVGDHPDEDVMGALNSGGYAIWMNRDGLQWPHAQQPTAMIKDISELSALFTRTR